MGKNSDIDEDVDTQSTLAVSTNSVDVFDLMKPGKAVLDLAFDSPDHFIGIQVRGIEAFTDMMDELEDFYRSIGEPTYVVGSTAHYAAHVEYGTYKMGAQPYLRPATVETNQRMSDFINKANGDPDKALQLAALHLEAGAKRRAPVDTGKLRASIGSMKLK